jgi:hypothetical protein
MSDKLKTLSTQPAEVVSRLSEFVATLPSGAVSLQQDHSLDGIDWQDYFVEVTLLLVPRLPTAFDLAFYCTDVGVGFGLLRQDRLASAVGLRPRSEYFDSHGYPGHPHYCIFTEPWTAITPDVVMSIAKDVARGNASVRLGASRGRLACAETQFEVSEIDSYQTTIGHPAWTLLLSKIGKAEFSRLQAAPWS